MSLLQVLNVLVLLFIIGNLNHQTTFQLGLVELAISGLTQATVCWSIPGTRRPYASPEISKLDNWSALAGIAE